MKQDNKKLYESIMASVAREVKKALNEDNKENFDLSNGLNSSQIMELQPILDDTNKLLGVFGKINQEIHEFSIESNPFYKLFYNHNIHTMSNALKKKNIQLDEKILEEIDSIHNKYIHDLEVVIENECKNRYNKVEHFKAQIKEYIKKIDQYINDKIYLEIKNEFKIKR